jgi:hypothetical protein
LHQGRVVTIKVQGRLLGSEQIEGIRQLLRQHPEWSRRRLSQELCRCWEWRDPKGQLQDMAARALLLKLEQQGCIILPARRQIPSNRMRQKQLRPVEHAREPIQGGLAPLQPLAVRELSQWPDELALYEWLLAEHHYLSYGGTVGLNLKYLVRDGRGRPLSCLLFGSAAWKCAVRDQFIGWSAAAREARLQQLTNNTRFLIVPWVEVPQLASHVLSLVLGRLRRDWQSKYGRPLELVETFVDTSRFRGTCYRAANWLDLGQTAGRTRQDRSHRLAVAPKTVLVYPLDPQFRRHLCA